MRIIRSVHLPRVVMLLVVGMYLAVGVPKAAAQPASYSPLTDIDTQEAKGFVVIAPDARDRTGEFHAEVTVNVHGLEPATTYQVWRAIDLTPGGEFVPDLDWVQVATIVTSAGGAGSAHFIRGGGLFSGDEFDVLIQVRLDDGVTVALESDVMTVTVK